MQAKALAESDVTPWRARMPGFVPRAALPVLLSGLVGVSVSVNVATQAAITAEQTRGWGSPVDAAGYGTMFAAIVLLPLRPRVATWAAFVAALVMAADPGLPTLRVWWVAAAALVALVGILDGAGAARQTTIARRWGEPVLPGLAPRERRRVLAWGAGPVLVASLALVGAWASLALWQRDWAAVDAFRAEALVADGTVVAVDAANGWVDVAVGDRIIHAPSPSNHSHLGELVGVRYAPDGPRAELLDEAFDPAGALLPAAWCLAVAVVVLVSEELRRRELRGVVTQGAAAVRLRVVWVAAREWPRDDDWPASALDLIPSDEPDDDPRIAVRLRVRRLTPDEPPQDLFARGAWARAPFGADGEAALTDSALLELAHTSAPKKPARPRALPSTVVVVGLTHRGSHPLVLAGNDWYRSLRGAAVPVLRRSPRRPAKPPASRVSTAPPVSSATPSPFALFMTHLATSMFQITRRTGGAGPWLAILLVYPLVRLIASTGFDLETLSVVPFAGLLGYSWMAAVLPRLRLTDSGIWLRGAPRDEFVAWSRVERVVADQRGLVVRQVDGAAVLGVPKEHVSWLLPGIDDPIEAARECEKARVRSGTPPSSGPIPGPLPFGMGRPRSPLRVAPQILCGVAWSLAALAGLVVWIH